MTTTPEGIVPSVGGVILEPIPSARVSAGENPNHLLDEDGDAIGVVTFLEASLVETHFGQMVEGLPVAWHGGSV